jgi:hypothetical protein
MASLSLASRPLGKKACPRGPVSTAPLRTTRSSVPSSRTTARRAAALSKAGAMWEPITLGWTPAARPQRKSRVTRPGCPDPPENRSGVSVADPLTRSADLPCRCGRRARRSPLPPGCARAPRPPDPVAVLAVLARVAARPGGRRLLLEDARVGDRARRRPRRWRAARRTARSRSSARRAAPSGISAEWGVARHRPIRSVEAVQAPARVNVTCVTPLGEEVASIA